MAICIGDDIVQVIERTECIGNSLTKINSNFMGLDTAICETNNAIDGLNNKINSLTSNVSNLSAIRGILKSDGAGTISAAISGVDYYVPGTVLNANLYATGDVVAYYSSDKRLKNDVTQIPNALTKVLSIHGVQYTWNAELQDTYKGEDVGVIAQEVEKVLPTAVIDRDNGYKAVKYERLIPLLIEAIKDLKNEIDALKH